MNVVPLSPLTSIKILKNIPFDNKYKDVLDFSNTSAQISYFTSKAKHTFTNLSPVRLQNAIRLPLNADSLYDCNYLMFQNANFGNKWFYAFITKVNFENVNMCTVEFEVDIWQTWQFEINLKYSYVLREHASTDEIGDNLVTESVDLGTYREKPAEKTTFFDSYTAVVATSYVTEGKTGGYKGGLFTGLNYIGALVDEPTQIQTLIDYLDALNSAGKSDSITSLFQMPTDFYTNDELPIVKRFDAVKEVTLNGVYAPKNKKLLTYPYNFLYVFTAEGTNAIYRYEFFQADTCGFLLECAMSCNPEIMLEPIAYHGQQFNIDESISMSGFPQCAYSIDSFRAWLAQNASGTLLNLTAMGASTGMSYVGSNYAGVVGGVMGIAGTVNNVVMQSIKPPIIRGSQGNSTFTGTREKNFYFVNKHVSAEYAKIIDDYFSKYGYATHELKIPNITGRPSWNYVQTDDCKLTGAIPFNDIAKLKEMFNAGVTFWHGDYVGDYSRNNQLGG